MEHPSTTGLPGSSNTIDPFASTALRLRDPLSQAASTPDALRLSPEDAITLRQQAERVLNATLYAAAERVRYITGASGVALALCETEEDEMVCRAGSGSTAPEVGTRMNIQSGITAESIRTRQTLRVDQASTDPRVNQETCKALGIESVMVMPLIVDRGVVGIFELFGEQPSAFGERDAKTLQGTAGGVQFALERAVNAGLVLGHIPWAFLPDPVPGAQVEEASGVAAATEVRSEPEAIPEVKPTPVLQGQQIEEETALRAPVVFPTARVEELDNPDESASEHTQSVPAFLARLADEAKPSSTKRWSQWFRPQW